MTRRWFISLAAVFMSTPMMGKESGPKLSKFIITFPRDIKANEPIVVEAKDSLWAITGLGATVWTEQEWNERNRLTPQP